jgi:hypothetical protein
MVFFLGIHFITVPIDGWLCRKGAAGATKTVNGPMRRKNASGDFGHSRVKLDRKAPKWVRFIRLIFNYLPIRTLQNTGPWGVDLVE